MSNGKRLLDGLPIVDATRDKIIHISTRDLTGGYTMLPNYCVVAHALGRNENGHQEAKAQPNVVLVKDGNHWVRYMPEARLRLEIIIHDRGGEFKAGDYYLKVPRGTKVLGSKHDQSKPPSGKTRRHRYIEGVRPKLFYERSEKGE